MNFCLKFEYCFMGKFVHNKPTNWHPFYFLISPLPSKDEFSGCMECGHLMWNGGLWECYSVWNFLVKHSQLQPGKKCFKLNYTKNKLNFNHMCKSCLGYWIHLLYKTTLAYVGRKLCLHQHVFRATVGSSDNLWVS